MMRFRHLFENFDLARFALSRWAHDEATLKDYFARFRISSNAIYPFADKGETRFLRLSPFEEKRESDLIAELEWIAYLRANGYPANAVVPSLSGERVEKLDTPWGGYYACVFARVRGEQLEDCAYTPELLRGYGAMLGKLHNLSEGYAPRARRGTHIDALDDMALVFAAYPSIKRAPEKLSNLRASLDRLPRTNANYGLNHFDFEPDNVFYDAETGDFAVIDFDDAMYHWYALDIEAALGEVYEAFEGQGERAAAERAFLAGYRSQRPFTESDEAARPLMKRFLTLYQTARIIRASVERLENEPDWMLGLRERLSGKLRRCEQAIDAMP